MLSDLVEIVNNSNASSPQADFASFASFARITKRISSIATPVLYRSIRLTDGRSAQLLVRTYLDGINPFTLVKSTQFKRAELHEVSDSLATGSQKRTNEHTGNSLTSTTSSLSSCGPFS